MSLHTRLLLAYGYLVTLVLIGAVGAALGFNALGRKIGTVLDDNHENVQASMIMLEALERQDSAVLTALLQKEGARRLVVESEGAFLDGLSSARRNLIQPREREALDAIAGSYERYREARDRLLESEYERPLVHYERECFPYFEPVKVGVRELLELNHQAMIRADRQVQATATRRAVGYAALAGLALLSMGFLSRSLNRHVADRLDELRVVAESVAEGDLSRRAAEGSDELGQVARELNRLLDAHGELRGALQAGRSRLRHLLVGLLRAGEAPAALLTLAGEVVASTLDQPTTDRVERAAVELGSEAEPAGGSELREREISTDGEAIRFRMLVAVGDRPVGWLARPAAR